MYIKCVIYYRLLHILYTLYTMYTYYIIIYVELLLFISYEILTSVLVAI